MAVDRASGRLRGLQDSTGVSQRWYSLSDWHALEGGVTFPALIECGGTGQQSRVIHYSSLAHGQALGPEVFPAWPGPALGELEDVASLRLAHGMVPGTLAVLVPEGGVVGERALARDVWTLLDTGAIGLALAPELAGQLGLPLLGGVTYSGLLGGAESKVLWVDRLQLGRHAVLQLPAGNPPLPALGPLPREKPLGVVFGGPRLMELSPVLDLRARRLWLRGATDGRVRPLSEIAGRPTLDLPLSTDERGYLRVEWSLGGEPGSAMLDTGINHVARLSRADMRRLGKPLDDGEWRRRGALYQAVGGINGHLGAELLVRLEQDLQLGPVTLRRPFVVLMGEAAENAGDAADLTLIGMGAFSDFEQVGFDRGRTLELLAPGELVAPGEPSRVVVPAREDRLGFDLLPADIGATSRPHNLPHVVDVLPDGAAERAGLRDGDFLAEVEGQPCDGVPPMDLWDRLRLRGRARLAIAVLREGQRLDLQVAAPGS